MKKLIRKIGNIPHLFAKLTIIWCIGFGSAASYYSLRILSHTGHDASATLAIILGFFGGELLLLLFKTVLKKDDASRSDERGDTYNE